MNMIRFFSSAARSTATSALAQLRKNTGFTLSNCRKALEECENDLVEAEKWLHAEAKRLGWEKATKLQSRSATEGLIGIARKNDNIYMVEVNCETDFVAKNEKFVSLVQVVANACVMNDNIQSDTITKKNISQEELGNLITSNTEKLSDYVAQRIGEFGENIVLRRGFMYKADKGINVDVAVHPPITDSRPVLTGKYGAFVAYKTVGNSGNDIITENLGTNLCKQIIYSSPKEIGEKEDKSDETVNEDDLEFEMNHDENSLLKQNYILDPGLTIGELLEESGVEMVDFGRFECGEDIDKATENQNQHKKC